MTKLEAMAVVPDPCVLAAAPSDRPWMASVPGNHAARCLPMMIANCHGWELRLPADVQFTWNGGLLIEDLVVSEGQRYAESHFSNGIVTFQVGYVLRTDPGWNTFVTGPLNYGYDGMEPLSAVIETDWLPYTFTMNWRMTRPGTVRLLAGAPIGHLMPMRRGDLDDIEPEILDVTQDLDLFREFREWTTSRDEFMRQMEAKDPEVLKRPWQKFYFAGGRPGSPVQAPEDHTMKLRLHDPVDRRAKKA